MKKLNQKNLHAALEVKNSFIVLVCGILVFFVFLNTAFAKEGFLERSGNYKPVDASLIEDLLTDLEFITKENYDKIETWQGTRPHVSMRMYKGDDVNDELQSAEIDAPVIPVKLKTIAEGTTKFKVDCKRNMLWSYMNFPRSLSE